MNAQLGCISKSLITLKQTHSSDHESRGSYNYCRKDWWNDKINLGFHEQRSRKTEDVSWEVQGHSNGPNILALLRERGGRGYGRDKRHLQRESGHYHRQGQQRCPSGSIDQNRPWGCEVQTDEVREPERHRDGMGQMKLLVFWVGTCVYKQNRNAVKWVQNYLITTTFQDVGDFGVEKWYTMDQ